jgi:hypothetical protein
MDRIKLFSSIITGTMLLSPVVAFAAETKTADVTEEEAAIIDAVEAIPADGRGGGGAGMSSIYPPYYGGGVMVDASITKEVKPDFVALNAYCDLGKQPSREAAKTEANKIFMNIKNAVGSDGRVRRMGTVSVYPYYDQTGSDTGSYSANISIFIRVIKTSAAQRISDAVEKEGCGASWDVRLTDPQSFEMSVLDELAARLNKRKAVFEKLLGKKLNRVVSASLNTWADGYSSYDPETNTVDATTTLSISFDVGGRTTITPSTTRTAPKG